jgi:hypothetical protein
VTSRQIVAHDIPAIANNTFSAFVCILPCSSLTLLTLPLLPWLHFRFVACSQYKSIQVSSKLGLKKEAKKEEKCNEDDEE